MSDHQRVKLYRDALKRIEKELEYIEPADLSTAEQNIWSAIQRVKKESGWR